MDFCLRPKISHDESDDEVDKDSSPTASSPLLSGTPGDNEVFLQESAFGSFMSSPENTSPSLWPYPSPRSRRLSSSSDSDRPYRQGSMKHFFRRSLSFLKGEGEGKPATNLPLLASNSPFLEVKESLLHVYRTNTFPPEGVNGFHRKVARLVISSGGGLFGTWWREDVVPMGTCMLAVTVASPRDGDRLNALLTAWNSLYTTTLPLLQSLLAPVTSLDVRGDVLAAFRDTVVPYADLISIISSQPNLIKTHAWNLKQMALLLTSLGPCSCALKGVTKRKFEREEEEVEEQKQQQQQQQQMQNTEEREYREEKGDTMTDHEGTENSTNSEEGLPFSERRGNHMNEILSLLLSGEMRDMSVSWPVMQGLLHLHHGGGDDHHNALRQYRLSTLQRLEMPPSPGQWLKRSPTSVLTLEELLRSAAAR